jgi:hypothetical protein
MIDIRLPNITATDTEGKMSQMQSYMHQLVEQLNWALATVDNAIQGNTANVVMTSQKAQNSEEEAVNTFNSIKALIIKSADIVKAYEETMKTEFNGEYIAVSDFGTYLAETNRTVEENSRYAIENFANVQTVTKQGATLGELETYVNDTQAYIKSGHLRDDEDGNPIYGIEIGQTTKIKEGEEEKEKFRGFARVIANRLAFYDENDKEVAYISDRKLYVTEATFVNATFKETILFGNYKADASDGLAFTWIGG